MKTMFACSLTLVGIFIGVGGLYRLKTWLNQRLLSIGKNFAWYCNLRAKREWEGWISSPKLDALPPGKLTEVFPWFGLWAAPHKGLYHLYADNTACKVALSDFYCRAGVRVDGLPSMHWDVVLYLKSQALKEDRIYCWFYRYGEADIEFPKYLWKAISLTEKKKVLRGTKAVGARLRIRKSLDRRVLEISWAIIFAMLGILVIHI